MTLLQQLQPAVQLATQFLGPQQAGVGAEAEHPRDDAPQARVAGEKDPLAPGLLGGAVRLRSYGVNRVCRIAGALRVERPVIGRQANLSLATVMARNLPGDPL